MALWPVATHGQSSELDAAYNRFVDLYAQGRYEEAVPFAEKAVRLGEEEFGPNDPTTATLLNNLAELYRAQGRYAEAEPLYQRSLAIREKTLGPKHPDVVQSLESYAALLRETDREEKAEKMEARAKGVRAKYE